MRHYGANCKTPAVRHAANARKRLSFFELAFLHDAFVRLAHAFDAVMLLAIAVRKLSDNFIKTVG
jgi:hypothetical protein